MSDCFCEENSFGILYIVVPDGFCSQGSLVIFAESKEKLKEILNPYKFKWNDWEFEIEFEETISASPALLNTVISDTLDMV